jgi:DNA-binding MarR family transcriptional regulator
MVLTSLRQIIRALDVRSRYLAKTVGLTVPQLVVLTAIDESPEITAGQIAEVVSLSQATVTSIIDRLESRGLVSRVRSEHDRRKVWIGITGEGKSLLEASPTILHEEFVKAFDKLEEWEQTQILSSLQRVARMMNAQSLNDSLLVVSDDLPSRYDTTLANGDSL